MRPVFAIARAELVRFLRDRSNIFFVFIFPLLLVLVLGSQFGGSGDAGRVSIAGETGPVQTALTEQLEAEDLTVDTGAADEVREQVARGRVGVGLFIPEGSNDAYQSGEQLTIEMVPSSSANALAVQQRVGTAVSTMQLEQAQVSVLTERGVDAGEAEDALTQARGQATPPSVQVEDVDEIAQEFSGLGQFDLGGVSQLLLFVFLISLAASGSLIQARREGVIARSLAAPVHTSQVVGGQALGRFTIALFQGLYIMVATGLLFGVDWGNPLLATAILIAFASVASGAAMLLGSVIDNEGAASGIGVGLGLVLAGMGGGMVPLEVFSDTLRQVAHITPHAWAYEAFAEVQRHDGGLVEILPNLGVLAAMAVLTLTVGAWAMRRSVARAM